MREYDLRYLDGSRPDWGAFDLQARQLTLTDGMPAPV
jgi:hypothetical protein